MFEVKQVGSWLPDFEKVRRRDVGEDVSYSIGVHPAVVFFSHCFVIELNYSLDAHCIKFSRSKVNSVYDKVYYEY